MNRIKRTSVDIKNFKDIASDLFSTKTTNTTTSPSSPSGRGAASSSDAQLSTLQRLEHLINSIKEIIKFLSSTPLLYETQRYSEPLHNLVTLHRFLRSQYQPSSSSSSSSLSSVSPLPASSSRPLAHPSESASPRTVRSATTALGVGRTMEHAKLVEDGVLRLVQYTDLVPLAFYKEKSGSAVHDLQTVESRKKVLLYAKVLKDRSETMLELAKLPVP